MVSFKIWILNEKKYIEILKNYVSVNRKMVNLSFKWKNYRFYNFESKKETNIEVNKWFLK